MIGHRVALKGRVGIGSTAVTSRAGRGPISVPCSHVEGGRDAGAGATPVQRRPVFGMMFALRVAVLMVIALSTLIVDAAADAGALARQDHQPLEIGVTRCERAPDSLAPPALARAGCIPAAGVRIEVRRARGAAGETGEAFGDCVAAANPEDAGVASCNVPVPFGVPIEAVADAATLPPGSAPLDEALFVPPLLQGVPDYPQHLIVVAPAAGPVASPAATVGTGPAFSIAVDTFVCAPGVTAAEVPADCTPTSEELPVLIASLEGVAQPLEPVDAVRGADGFVFGSDVIERRGMFGRLDVRVADRVPGSGYVVRGDAVTYDPTLDRFVLRLFPDAPEAEIAIYILQPEEALQLATAQPGPPGLEVAIHDRDCDTAGPDQFASPLVSMTPPRAESDNAPIEVASWLGVIPAPVADLGTGQTIVVRPAPDGGGEGSLSGDLACGAFNNAATPSGPVTAALRGEGGDSGLSGIAFLSPHPADPSQSDVIVFLAELRP